MTRHRSQSDAAQPGTTESIIDPESLRDDEAVPFHEERDEVDDAVVDEVSSLPDMAGVGIENPDGAVLFRRATDTCSWKIPVVNVGPDEDFAGKLTEHVRETIGFDVELDDIAGVWTINLRTEDESRTASRAFVIFSASSDSYDLDAATPTGDPVEEAGWFDDLPDGADEIPGTALFLE